MKVMIINIKLISNVIQVLNWKNIFYNKKKTLRQENRINFRFSLTFIAKYSQQHTLKIDLRCFDNSRKLNFFCVFYVKAFGYWRTWGFRLLFFQGELLLRCSIELGECDDLTALNHFSPWTHASCRIYRNNNNKIFP